MFSYIDWKNLSVIRVKTDRLKGTSEKIKIVVEGINYAPAGIAGLSITTTFSRKKGAVARLTRLGEFKFVAEIIDEKEGYLFFLLGLR